MAVLGDKIGANILVRLRSPACHLASQPSTLLPSPLLPHLTATSRPPLPLLPPRPAPQAQTAKVPIIPWSGDGLTANLTDEGTIPQDIFDKACVTTVEEVRRWRLAGAAPAPLRLPCAVPCYARLARKQQRLPAAIALSPRRL